MALASLYRVVQDQQGNLVTEVLGTITVTGTSTLATLYSDAAGTAPLPNPLINNPVFGSYNVFVPAGSYDMSFVKVGYTFEPQRNIVLRDPAAGVSQIFGTTNQVGVNPASGIGAVTLYLPQNIAPDSSVQFAHLGLGTPATGNALQVSGVSAFTGPLNADVVVFGNPATDPLSQLTSTLQAGTGKYFLNQGGNAPNILRGRLQIGEAPAMMVDALQSRVGIGVGMYAPAYPLDVTGQVRVTGSVGLGTLPVAGYSLQTGGGWTYLAPNVGIGVTPAYAFDVTGQVRVTGNVGLGTPPVEGYSLQTGGGATYLAPNVGIGVTPAYPLDVTGQMRVTGSVGLGTPPVAGYSLLTGGWTSLAANVGIGVSGQPQYPLDVVGQVRIQDRLHVGTTPRGFAAKVEVLYDKTAQQAVMIQPGGDAGGGAAMIFLNAAGVTVGTIMTTGAATVYNTTSDTRLKHAIQALGNALSAIQALRPVRFRWNADDSQDEGFLAHELQQVIPHAVTGEPDQVGVNGEILPQQVDNSKIVVWLVGAVQELATRVQALEGAA